MMSSHLYRDENLCVADMLRLMDWPEDRSQRVSAEAANLIRAVRGAKRKSGSIENFFQQYALSTPEGIALMCLAEALLRIPDGPTAGDLIRDKVAGTKWLKGLSGADWATRAAGLGLAVSAGTMNSVLSRLGEPVVRAAMARAMRLLGGQFVVGQTLTEAQKAARKLEARGFRLSYDMLGEGARTMRDADHYYAGYAAAIDELDTDRGEGRTPGISVKLSALHPRYEVAQADRCVPDLSEKLFHLCRLAAKKNITLTVDAEETERLEISLDILSRAAADPETAGWNGLGLAVQAYQKRAMPLIDRVLEMARRHNRKLQVRLVKGAYWDSEIKKAQVKGLPDYPVYTRKINTDLSYLICAQKMLSARHLIHPMFGTHNAHTVAAILDMAGKDTSGFEFQKLFGMGDALYAHIAETKRAPVTIYAPVGVHQDLLPYLVRRMLENGANSSFVNKVYDADIAPDDLAADPVAKIREQSTHTHPQLPKPEQLFGLNRANSRGVDLNDLPARDALSAQMHQHFKPGYAAPLIAGKIAAEKGTLDFFNPAKTSEKIGQVVFTSEHQIEAAFIAARTGQAVWSALSAAKRADVLSRAADLLEDHRAHLMALCVREAGKTIPDALAEVREAVDFCRYYAAEGRRVFDESGTPLPGPTGENNVLKLTARGTFVAISPWNFPLAIFTGQIMAALMAGNAVIAKPAEQTSIIAFETVKLFHKAGVPTAALTLLPGDGRIGAALVAHPDVAGVAFTGSTEAAQSINRALAAKNGPIVPFIAETGGQNAMIMDSSALPEQVVDDVVLSAFGSTGQRCSACRVLFVQEEVATKTLDMLKGAMAELRVGDPQFHATDIGPVIDEPALAALVRHRARLEGFGKLIAQAPLPDEIKQRGTFFAPIAYEIPALEYLEREVFGPVLHVIRYRAENIDAVIDAINKTGYGLTLGVHTRIDAFARKIAGAVRCGNIYVNRSMIGAVVGVQPFGGMGLSGTGPKAGGPHYLARFATEKVISTNTAAAGGNASLVMMGE